MTGWEEKGILDKVLKVSTVERIQRGNSDVGWRPVEVGSFNCREIFIMTKDDAYTPPENEVEAEPEHAYLINEDGKPEDED